MMMGVKEGLFQRPKALEIGKHTVSAQIFGSKMAIFVMRLYLHKN